MTHVLLDYLRALYHYWVLIVLAAMPFNNIWKWLNKERKDLPIPHWLRVTISIAALVLAPFLAYRDQARNLKVVIDEKRDAVVQKDALAEKLGTYEIEVTGLQRQLANLRAAKARSPEPQNSLRRRTIRLANELNVFWSHWPGPQKQPVQNPGTDEERQRNAAWDQYWRDVATAYLNANYKERILGIVREYMAKGIPTGYLEQSVEQPNRLIGAAPYGVSDLDDCLRFMGELCQLRELAYHVDANDQPIFFVSPQP